jgi:hypothetical protein
MEHGALEADFLCCRHTLEHIPEPLEFLCLIRRSLGQRKDVILFFEVPDMGRILKTQAFWDIYYEHCSYFTAGSLARLFRSAGFEVLDLRLDFEGQYLRLDARPADPVPAEPHPIEQSVEEHEALVEEFRVRLRHRLQEWRERLVELKRCEKKTVLWGGGSKAVGFLTCFDDIGLIEYVVDINPHLEGNYIPGIGKQYVQPSFLESYRPEAVVIMNDVYQREIAATLQQMGLNPALWAL